MDCFIGFCSHHRCQDFVITGHTISRSHRGDFHASKYDIDSQTQCTPPHKDSMEKQDDSVAKNKKRAPTLKCKEARKIIKLIQR